jgi:hypothetical protein
MMTRLATAILPLSLLTACGVDFETDDQTETTPEIEPHAKLPVALESAAFTALGATKRSARVMRSNVDKLGKTHVRMRQIVRDVPVWGGEAIVHVAADGSTEVTDKREADLDVDTTPRVTADRAVELARVTCAACSTLAAPDLWIVREGQTRLVWRVQLAGMQSSGLVSPIVFVDAHDGSVVKSWDNVQHATGDTEYNGLQTIPALYHNGRYYLEDREFNIGVYDFNGNYDPDIHDYARIYSTDTTFQTRDIAQSMFSVRSAAEYFWHGHQHWNPDGVGGPGKVSAVDRVPTSPGVHGLSSSLSEPLRCERVVEEHALLGEGDDVTSDLNSLDIVGHSSPMV